MVEYLETPSLKKIVLEGCNGEWAQKHYLPFLAEKAAKENIRLWALDVQPQIQISADVTGSWQTAQDKGKASYLNKIEEKESYEHLPKVDYVFVVAPDRFHCEIAKFWLKRLSPEGKIFIEKPLDASIERAKELKTKLAGHDIVYGFDHYLAMAYPFLQRAASQLEKIGKIRGIEFLFLESSKISQNRTETLKQGIIFDLFCHVLAVAGAVAERNLTPSENILWTVKLEEVKAARYVDCPIPGETFACIEFFIGNSIKVVATFGKGVGKVEDKSMMIYGTNGQIKLDFKQKEKGKLESKPVESFLEAILQGKNPILAPGVISFDTAFAILELLCQAKEQVKEMPQYDVGTPVSEILTMLGCEPLSLS